MPQSRFVWYELLTTDIQAAEAFYTAVLGWSAREAGLSDMPYILFSTAETPVAGMMTLPQEAAQKGARPGWIGYIGVPDTDGATAQVAAAGGIVHRMPDDIVGIGRFSVVADPQGAPFVLFTAAIDRPGPEPAPGTPGHVGWHELRTTDRESAFAFYAGLFGWTKAGSIADDPAGASQFFAADGVTLGGMTTKPEAVPLSHWLYYITVAEVGAAAARVTATGGTVLFGPHQVPTGHWVLHGLDPQGAVFALAGPSH